MGEVIILFEWFVEQTGEVKAAIVTGCSGILVAIITGLFSLLGKKNKSKTTPTYTVNQTATGNNNTQIGIQNNFKKDE